MYSRRHLCNSNTYTNTRTKRYTNLTIEFCNRLLTFSISFYLAFLSFLWLTLEQSMRTTLTTYEYVMYYVCTIYIYILYNCICRCMYVWLIHLVNKYVQSTTWLLWSHIVKLDCMYYAYAAFIFLFIFFLTNNYQLAFNIVYIYMQKEKRYNPHVIHNSILTVSVLLSFFLFFWYM